MLNVKAVILVGARDFGRCPLASRLPTALWPVLGRPVLDRLLSHLAEQGVRRAVICSNGEEPLLAETISADPRLELEFYDELLPVGTAGCIRDAAGEDSGKTIIVIPAGITCPPQIGPLVSEHRRAGAGLTVMLNPCRQEDSAPGAASGIYLCNSEILQYIPPAGYFDIKEGLIPEMLSAGEAIHAAELQNDVGDFHDLRGYLRAIAQFMEAAPNLCGDSYSPENAGLQGVWVSQNARLESDARVYGPAVVMDGATVASGAVVLGPAVIERDVTVSENTVVAESVLWAGARVGPNSRIERSVIGRNAVLPGRSVVLAKAVGGSSGKGHGPAEASSGVLPRWTLASSLSRTFKISRDYTSGLKRWLHPLFARLGDELPAWIRVDRKTVLALLGSVVVVIAFIWSYGPGLTDLWHLWNESDEYSSGLLVPFLAAYILWSRRPELSRCPIKPCAWGVLVFAGAQGIRFFGLLLMYSSAERLSMVLSIAALALLLFGWRLFRKISPVMLFLCLMLPWPNFVQNYVGLTLQRYATSSAVFCLEVVGYEIVQEGNVIHIADVSVAVAEACNGLRMITAFFVITGLVVLLIDRAWWEKLIVLLSSLPIALLCNTVRLAVTAIFFTVLQGEHWEDIFHDFGGYAMMPLALATTVGELWLLKRLTALPAREEAIIITRQTG